VSLGAWLWRPRDERGLVSLKPKGRLDFQSANINAAIRKRQIGAFRRAHGEAVFELPAGETEKGPFVTRKLWISVDPTTRRWRVTRVSAKGPQGHTEFRSWSDAVYMALVDHPRARLSAVTSVKNSDVGRVRRGSLGLL